MNTFSTAFPGGSHSPAGVKYSDDSDDRSHPAAFATVRHLRHTATTSCTSSHGLLQSNIRPSRLPNSRPSIASSPLKRVCRSDQKTTAEYIAFGVPTANSAIDDLSSARFSSCVASAIRTPSQTSNRPSNIATTGSFKRARSPGQTLKISNDFLLNFECEIFALKDPYGGPKQTGSPRQGRYEDNRLCDDRTSSIESFLNCYCLRQFSEETNENEVATANSTGRSNSAGGSSGSVNSTAGPPMVGVVAIPTRKKVARSLSGCGGSEPPSLCSRQISSVSATSASTKSVMGNTAVSGLTGPKQLQSYVSCEDGVDGVSEGLDWTSCSTISLSSLFNPLSNVVGKLFKLKRQMENVREDRQYAGSAGSSWQDKLLYRSRQYITEDLREAASRVIYQDMPDSTLLGSKDFKSYQFYRRMLEGFDDNWVTLEPLILPPIFERRRKNGDAGRPPLLPAGFAISPFHLDACRITPTALAAFFQLLERTAPIYKPPTPNAFEDGYYRQRTESERRSTVWPPPLGSLLAHVTRDALLLRRPKDWLSPAVTPLFAGADTRSVQPAPQYRNSPPFPFFSMPWKGRCRLVVQRAYLTARNNGRNLHSTSASADDSRDASLVGSLELLKAASQHDQLLGISSTIAGPSDVQQPHILMLFGGKDMLALDWLPFVSRMLHNLITRKTSEKPSTPMTGGDDSNRVKATFRTLFLLPEYPGYGFSLGNASPQTCVESSIAILRSVTERYQEGGPLQLHIIGYSLGAGVALECTRWLMKNYNHHKLPVVLNSLNLMAAPTTVSACAAHMLKVPEAFQSFVSSLLAKFETESISWDNETTLMHIIQLLIAHPERYESLKINILHGELDEMVSSSLIKKLVIQCKECLLEGMRRLRRQTAASPTEANLTTKDKIHNLQNILQNFKFVLIPEATHLSIAANPAHQTIVFDALYNPDFIL